MPRRSMEMDLMPGELLEEDGHTGSDLDQTREFTKVLIRPGWEVYGKGELLLGMAILNPPKSLDPESVICCMN